MNEPNVVNLQRSTRCSACKLPDDVLASLHQDRFRGGMGFGKLALKYAEHRPLSEPGVRRHFTGHVSVDENSSIPRGEPSTNAVDAVPSSGGTAPADNLDPNALLETGTQILGEMVQALAQEYREAATQQRAQAADRAFTKFMKAHAELTKAVRQVEAGRAARDEFRKTIPGIVQRCTSTAMHAILPVMRQNAAKVRDEIVEYSNGRLSGEEFWKRLVRYEFEWPEAVGAAMRKAQTEALKTEEAKVEA